MFKRMKKLSSALLAALLMLGGMLGVIVPGGGSVHAAPAMVWDAVGDPGFSAGTASYISLAVYNGTPYVAYMDSGNSQKAAVKKYDGSKWVAVGNAGFLGKYYSLVVDNGTPYVAYSDYADGTGKATVMKYTGSWEPAGPVAFSTNKANYTSVTTDVYGTPYVAYVDFVAGVTVKKLNGSSWDTVGQNGSPANSSGLSTHTSSKYVSLKTDASGIPYVAYKDGADSKAKVMKFDASTDQWVDTVTDPAYPVSAVIGNSTSLAIDNGKVYVAYQEDSTNSSKATVMKYNGSGWETVGSAGFSAEAAYSISLAVDNGTPYVAYTDGANDGKATVMKYSGSGWETVGSAGFSEGSVGYNSLVVDNGTPYVAYSDGANSSKATVMKLSLASPSFTAETTEVDTAHDIEYLFADDPAWRAAITSVQANSYTLTEGTDYTISPGKVTLLAGRVPSGNVTITIKADGYARATVSQLILDAYNTWQNVGDPGFSEDSGQYPSVTTDVYGTPYVAYVDGLNGVTVQKLNGNSWETVGKNGSPANSSGLSTNTGSSYTSLKIDASGIPYVAYRDGADGKAKVMKYDVSGDTWIDTVTDPAYPVSAVIEGYTSLAIDNGTLYVVYEESYENGNKATVMTYNGSGWVSVGDPGLSDGEVDYVSLAVSNGTPYVGYADAAIDYKSTVKKYNGISWETVGSAGFSATYVSCVSLAVSNGTPYVAFQDSSNDEQKVTAMKYTGNTESGWEIVGSPGFSTGDVDDVSLAVSNGTPYVAYQDWYYGSKMTVKKFDGSKWMLEGLEGFSAGDSSYNSLHVYRGIPYVAFQDESTANQGITVMKSVSSDNNLSGISLSTGTLDPVFSPGTTSYTATVTNHVASLTVTPTAQAGLRSSVTVNGVPVTSGQASGPIDLDVGDNPITIVVTAQDGTSTKTYTIDVTRAAAPSSGGGGGGGGPIGGTDESEHIISIDGETKQAIAMVTTSEQDGQTVLTVTVDAAKLAEQLEQAGNKPVVTIPVTASADKVTAALTGDAIKAMENKDAILEVQTPNGSYKLPASEVLIDKLSKELGAGTKLEDITLHVDIAKSDITKVELLADAADKNKFTVVMSPVDFTITAKFGEKTVQVTKFNSFVEREIPLPAGVDASKITTAVVLDEDGTTRSVPTKIVTRDGVTYAVINSLTNSTYSVVWNPIAFEDVEQHWSKDAVNEMGSRMVISGIGNGLFNPDQDITRAEFAAIMVRGLGLKLETGSTSFSDVKSSDWYHDAIQTAYAYNLINGFEDGTFRPNDKITREQAMVIIAKAMGITKLEGMTLEQTAEKVLQSFADTVEVSSWAKNGVADSVQAGIVSGRDSKHLAPKAFITRAEVATIIQRLLQKSDLI